MDIPNKALSVFQEMSAQAGDAHKIAVLISALGDARFVGEMEGLDRAAQALRDYFKTEKSHD